MGTNAERSWDARVPKALLPIVIDVVTLELAITNDLHSSHDHVCRDARVDCPWASNLLSGAHTRLPLRINQQEYPGSSNNQSTSSQLEVLF